MGRNNAGMMSGKKAPLPVFRKTFIVSEEVIDTNGHVNNVRYVHWMQDLAVEHWEQVGGMAVNQSLGCTWVARSHHIEYLKPAFAGDEVEAMTWVETIGRVRSLRKYAFRRIGETRPLAQGETDWVFVDVQTGHPRAIPRDVEDILPVTPQAPL